MLWYLAELASSPNVLRVQDRQCGEPAAGLRLEPVLGILIVGSKLSHRCYLYGHGV